MTTEKKVSKRVEFFKDGDLNFNSVNVALTEKKYANFDVLLNELSGRVPLPFGVRNVYTPKGRKRVENVEEFKDGGQYVCTSQKKIKRLDYTKTTKRPFILPRPPSNTKYQPPMDQEFFKKRRAPKLLTVVSHENAHNMTRYVLKPRAENFDMVLQDLSNKLRLNGGPVSALMTTEGKMVSLMSH